MLALYSLMNESNIDLVDASGNSYLHLVIIMQYFIEFLTLL